MMLTRFSNLAGLSILGATLAGLLATASSTEPVDAGPEEHGAQAQPVLAELAWIAGTWREERGQDVLEERWDPALGNAMTGTMRWLKDGTATLYEFLLLEEDASGVHLYVRHFTPGCVSREEKDAPVTLQLAEVTEDTAVFTSESEFPRRYEMRKGSDGVLHAALEGVKGGKPTKLEFAYKPVAR
jgi:Domain of unknown function (DUF6265)